MSEARIRCMCGNIHSIPLDRARNGLGVAHWKCTDCLRRFVLTHSEPDTWTPVYLDVGVRSVDLRETGPSEEGTASRGPMPPPAIDFDCRCGLRQTAHSWMYGGTSVCPACKASLYLALKWSVKRKVHVIVPEYTHKAPLA